MRDGGCRLTVTRKTAVMELGVCTWCLCCPSPRCWAEGSWSGGDGVCEAAQGSCLHPWHT